MAYFFGPPCKYQIKSKATKLQCQLYKIGYTYLPFFYGITMLLLLLIITIIIIFIIIIIIILYCVYEFDNK